MKRSTTKSSSFVTEKLIEIVSSDDETSGNESSDEDYYSDKSHRMTNVQQNCDYSSVKNNSDETNKHSTKVIIDDNSSHQTSALSSTSQHTQTVSLPSDNTAEIEIDQVQIRPQSKWSNSGGSVLGLLATSSDSDYSLWLRIREKKRIKEANTSFFGSTILSFFSTPSKEKYSFDNILAADDDSKLNSPSSYLSGQDKDRLISNKNQLKDSFHSENNRNNNKNITKNSKTLRDKRKTSMNSKMLKIPPESILHNESETQKLMLSNGALCATTNINLNDDDDNEFLSKEKQTGSCCDFSLYKGIFYALLSSLFFSLSCVIVKYLKNIHPGQLAVARYVGVLTLSIPLVVYHRQSPFGPPEMRHLLVLRGVSGATSLFLRFYAFRYLPIADASVIVFAIPIFVSIFGHFFLNEPCGLFQTFIVFLAMIGLMLSSKVPILFGDTVTPLFSSNNHFFGNFTLQNSSLHKVEVAFQKISPLTVDKHSHLLGVSAGLASLLFTSAVFVFIRKAKGVHYSVIMVWFGAVAIIETTILTLFLHGFSMPQTPFEWRLMIFLAVFAFCGQILLTRALQLEYAGSVSVARSTSDIAFGFLWQISIFNELPDGYSISGALLVSSCIFLITIKNWVNSLPEHSKIRSRLRFVTF